MNHTFQTGGEARTFAAIHGFDFDNQGDYCEACAAYHVGAHHADEVPTECGSTLIAGFDVVLECQRPPHDDDPHRNTAGTSWNRT